MRRVIAVTVAVIVMRMISMAVCVVVMRVIVVMRGVVAVSFMTMSALATRSEESHEHQSP